MKFKPRFPSLFLQSSARCGSGFNILDNRSEDTNPLYDYVDPAVLIFSASPLFLSLITININQQGWASQNTGHFRCRFVRFWYFWDWWDFCWRQLFFAMRRSEYVTPLTLLCSQGSERRACMTQLIKIARSGSIAGLQDQFR